MVLVRARVSSFLAGFAVAAGLALYQLRQDIWESHRVLAAQAETVDRALEERVAQLEAALAQKQL
eukprot:jgi/Botrbrau1/16667/Bobra.0068s0083.1